MFRKILAATVALGVLAGASAQAATPQSSYSLEISGYVPTICNAQLSTTAAPAQATTVSLGQLKEFCNDAAGYQVWVDYSPSLAGDTLQVGSRTITLTSSGSAMIDESNGPGVTAKDVTLNVGQPGVSGALSLRVVAL